MSDVRTRFAPSPTGWLHLGGIRTAVFAWLIAKQASGKFILRLEDTDKAREVTGSDKHIMSSLKWLGLDWDEGPDKVGPYGPYRQSERLSIYKEWGQRLIEAGRAYGDPYSETELEKLRDEAKANKKAFLFRDHRPSSPPAWDGETPLRFKSEPRAYTWRDEVMGKLSTGPEAIDDFILIKSDGFPTYNFAHIVDDHLMKISHVIRSQEFLSSVPRYLNLYEALKIDQPKLVTLPYVLNNDGNKKMSKREGAKDILDYAKEGYLPDALFNFIVTLGWNDGSTQEVFSRNEVVKKFDIQRVGKAGAKFDNQRLNWLDGHYIRELPVDELYELSETFWPKQAASAKEAYKKSVLGLVQERLKFLSELPDLTTFFFEDLPVKSDLIKQSKALAEQKSDTLIELLKQTREVLAKTDFTVNALTDALNNLLKELDQTPSVLFGIVRLATTWSPASPALADTLAVLGKETALRRIDQSISSLA